MDIYNLNRLPFIKSLDLTNKHIFLRTDFNVPLINSNGDYIVADDNRIRATLPTINYILENGGKLTIASHLGRPEGKNNENFSLLPVAEKLSELLNIDVILADDCIGDAVRKLKLELEPGQILLLENLRFHIEETTNDPLFSSELAQHTDIYINDAFGALHRSHASVTGIVSNVSLCAYGLCIQRELDFLSKLINKPQQPCAAIIGGAKVSDKIDIILNLIKKMDIIIIGGAMAYTFLKAQGVEIGKSLVEPEKVEGCLNILRAATEHSTQILLPVDHITAPSMTSLQTTITYGVDIPSDQMGLDIGPETISIFSKALQSAKTVFINGPMGLFENPLFENGTKAIFSAAAKLDALTVVGGGDSANAAKLFNLSEQFSHISTGGGASLEFIEGKQLPGLSALLH